MTYLEVSQKKVKINTWTDKLKVLQNKKVPKRVYNTLDKLINNWEKKVLELDEAYSHLKTKKNQEEVENNEQEKRKIILNQK